MQHILIIGYPKSGTTWISRLCGELLQAPVAGYYGAQHEDPARDGLSRTSNYICFKSHMSYDRFAASKGIHKAIYVIRDPRDIVISGAYYFEKPDQKRFGVQRLLKRLGRSKQVESMKEIMANAVLKGDQRMNPAMGMSWAAHIQDYLNDPSVLCIRYEDMIKDPIHQCQRILNHLEIERTSEEIANAIQAQSAAQMRKHYQETKSALGLKLVRDARPGQWKTALSAEIKHRLESTLKAELKQLNYIKD